jgi:MraZ protein
MFLGEQSLTLDEKGRLVLPSKFRTFITDPEDLKGFFIVADPRRIDRCLRLYTRTGYAAQYAQVKAAAGKAEDSLRFLRIYAAHSEFAPMDSQSRFLVPQKLVDYAGLGRDVVMVGMNDWLEIWDRGELKAQSEGSREKFGTLLSEALKPKLD